MHLNIPIQVLYAGLAGTALALFVAAAQNKWSAKVFFLLALRLAIGWHFLFEGLHKIHSHYVGPTETNRPFSSEPYFKDADGPLGPLVKKRVGDIDAQLKARLEPRNVPDRTAAMSANARARLGDTSIPAKDLVGMVPEAVEKDWKAFAEAFEKKFTLDAPQQERLKLYGDGAMAAYARWVVGIEGRDSTVKFVSTGKVPLTAPQRLDYIEHRQKDLDGLLARTEPGLGNGNGTDVARLKEARMLVSTAKAALLADADALLNDWMKAAFDGVLALKLDAASSPAKYVDKDDAKLSALLPVGKADAAGFDGLPPDVKKLWGDFQTAFKTAYPVGEKEKDVDELAAVAKERLARWMNDQDEYTGQPKPGISPLVKAYRDAQAKHSATKTAVDAALADLDGAWDASWLNRSTYSAARTLGEKAEKDAASARTALLNALDGKYAELRKQMLLPLPADVTEGKFTPPPVKPTEKMDWYTRWTLAAVGAMLLMGLFTRLACVVAAGFLVMTYLTHPPFPWLPNPPGTEGNPLFINKNVIEAIGLMVVMVHPTGRWMGLDAVIHRVLFRNSPEYLAKAKKTADRMPPKR